MTFAPLVSLAHHLDTVVAGFAPRHRHAVSRYLERYGVALEPDAFADQVAAIRAGASRLIGTGWGGRELHAIDVTGADGAPAEVFAVWDPRELTIVTYLDGEQRWRGGLATGADGRRIRRASR